jgi:threonylcarbamoyladenosine tRNA methylthiotransferase MtaB
MKFWGEASLNTEHKNFSFTVKTLGCKVNQHEADAIIADLEDAGFRYVSPDEKSDIFIINTCTVTGRAAMQARQAIRRAIRRNPDARIVVTGCYAQTEPDEIGKIPGVHHIVGQSDKHRISRLLRAVETGGGPRTFTKPVKAISDIRETRHFYPVSTTAMGKRTRPYLKIQDGCNAFCTYCIVPYARGRSRTQAINDVIALVEGIHGAGYLETVLTGIHVGCYGTDLNPPTNLYHLLRRILEETGIPRIRLSSIEPLELTSDIIGLAADSIRFCHHFHIPLQSGDNGILHRMNRPYTAEYYRDLVRTIHRQIPDCGIGSDVLSGFPGETPEAFENTFNLLEDLPITYLHVFPFSPRKGTQAEKFPNRVSSSVIKERCHALRLMGIRKKKAFFEKQVGKRVEVLIEGNSSPQHGRLKGMTKNYIPVRVRGPERIKNQIVTVEIQDMVFQNIESGSMYLDGFRVSS